MRDSLLGCVPQTVLLLHLHRKLQVGCPPHQASSPRTGSGEHTASENKAVGSLQRVLAWMSCSFPRWWGGSTEATPGQGPGQVCLPSVWLLPLRQNLQAVSPGLFSTRFQEKSGIAWACGGSWLATEKVDLYDSGQGGKQRAGAAMVCGNLKPQVESVPLLIRELTGDRLHPTQPGANDLQKLYRQNKWAVCVSVRYSCRRSHMHILKQNAHFAVHFV